MITKFKVEQPLSIIDNSSILEKEDFNKLSQIKEELNHVFRHTQIFRTKTEMEVSVLNDVHYPTPDGKYWQAIREQNVHFHELVMLSYEYRKNLIEIKKLQRELKEEEDDLEKELIQIEIDKKTFLSKDQERIAKDRIRELWEWHEIKEKLKPNLKYSLDDVNAHQLDTYVERWKKQVEILQDKGSAGERFNLFGQLNTGLRKKGEK